MGASEKTLEIGTVCFSDNFLLLYSINIFRDFVVLFHKHFRDLYICIEKRSVKSISEGRSGREDDV